jgi:hypothetical protein
MRRGIGRGDRLVWFLLQSSVVFAVVASNIRWQWTPNPYLAGLMGVGLAYGLMRLLGGPRLNRTLLLYLSLFLIFCIVAAYLIS